MGHAFTEGQEVWHRLQKWRGIVTLIEDQGKIQVTWYSSDGSPKVHSDVCPHLLTGQNPKTEHHCPTWLGAEGSGCLLLLGLLVGAVLAGWLI
jgi:hypothetical protein